MEKKGKTVLILGNGFDLAHGLPTRYSDFLDFCQMVEKFWSDRIIEKNQFHILFNLANIK